MEAFILDFLNEVLSLNAQEYLGGEVTALEEFPQ